jgi:spore germination cell wall hydrolase CwlJ-like protein
MKTLCTTIAFLSVLGFTMLVSSALFDMFYLHSYKEVSLPIPSVQHSNFVDNASIDCLAKNIYFESRGESDRGKLLVGMVVMERLQSPHFSHTVCGVVYAANRDSHGRIKRYQCSFSWVCDGNRHTINLHNIIDRREWVKSYAIARGIVNGNLKSKIDMTGVTHYHASYVKPSWSRNKNYKLVAHVGDHLFYRWKKAMLPKITIASR